MFLVSVALNYPWELAQSSLYKGGTPLGMMLWHCFAASLGDGLIVICIYAAGWMVIGREDWFVAPGAKGYLVMLGTGFAIGAGIEWAALNAGRWVYTEDMPRLPVLGLGLVPLAQMLVLPTLIFRLVAYREKARTNRPTKTAAVE